MQQPQPPAQMSIGDRYLNQCQQILPTVTDDNPSYKADVGQIFYKYTEELIGAEGTPKIIGMLLDMPIDDTRLIMQDFSLFQSRVNQACELFGIQPAH